ncbi:hypothetical protein ACQKLP_12855 [Chitinophaga sp. NPDC101104]|uniref:hypothetical protein n=1 Tax=Chitinophaga sp. NPDC101104 TaxID=3390561 RepID=UPI003D0296CD
MRTITSKIRPAVYISALLGLLIPFIFLLFGAALLSDAGRFDGISLLLCMGTIAAAAGTLVYWGKVTNRQFVWLEIDEDCIKQKRLGGYGAECTWRLDELVGYTIRTRWIRSSGAVEEIVIWTNGKKVITVLQPAFSNYLLLKDAIERGLKPIR